MSNIATPQEGRDVPKQGGTLRVNLASDTDSTDPAFGYHIVSWQYEYATQAKLLNHASKPGVDGTRLLPEVATDLPAVSDDERTYTFTVRSDEDAYRFNTGETVTAVSFAAAIDRALNPAMQSPASAFVDDIVGAQEVLQGRVGHTPGVRVLPGNRLQIELVEPAPDFAARIAMPFFAAIPENLPIVPEGVDTPPSAGPYHIASRERSRSIVLKRNPYYRHGRAHHVDEIVYNVGVDPNEALEQIERGEADFLGDGLPPEEEARLGAQYGLNGPRFMVSTTSLQLDYLAMNTSRPLFSDVRVRRAVNFALDRPELLQLRGAHSGRVTDHILPPGMPGFRDDTDLFPLDGPDVTRARSELPEGFEGGDAVVYTTDTLAGPSLGYCVRDNLAAIGITVEVKTIPDTLMHQLAGRRGEPFDGLLTGWVADYPDPFCYINALLHGSTIRETNNMNFAYFNDPVYNKKMDAAARLSGPERYEAYGELDIDISTNAVPWVSYDNRTARDFVSERVVDAYHHPVYGLDFATLWLR